MKHFPTMDELKSADVEKIAKIDEIPLNVAQDIYNFFHQEEG